VRRPVDRALVTTTSISPHTPPDAPDPQYPCCWRRTTSGNAASSRPGGRRRSRSSPTGCEPGVAAGLHRVRDHVGRDLTVGRLPRLLQQVRAGLARVPDGEPARRRRWGRARPGRCGAAGRPTAGRRGFARHRRERPAADHDRHRQTRPGRPGQDGDQPARRHLEHPRLRPLHPDMAIHRRRLPHPRLQQHRPHRRDRVRFDVIAIQELRRSASVARSGPRSSR
jgi:hypothetical protein